MSSNYAYLREYFFAFQLRKFTNRITALKSSAVFKNQLSGECILTFMIK